MSGYGSFALFYDRLIQVDYAARADYLLSLFARHGCATDSLLDLACGSGTLTVELAQRGCDMIGVDGSADMLAVAREKPEAAGLLFLEQDMRELDLYGTVDGAVCALDSFNHLLSTADLAAALARLSLFVKPDGLLIFDVNTPYKHRTVLGDNTFVLEQDGLMCVWQNRLIAHTCEVEMLLDIFAEDTDGQYERYSETVRERAYSLPTWRKLLVGADFELLAVYGDMTTAPPADDEERWVLVARNRTDRYACDK